jgi:hypothetical protein
MIDGVDDGKVVGAYGREFGGLPAALGGGVGFLPLARLLAVCLRRWPFPDLVGCAALVWLCFYGVGLSLFSYWFISVAPVRGGHLLLFAAAKRSKQEKAAQTANS